VNIFNILGHLNVALHSAEIRCLNNDKTTNFDNLKLPL